MERVEKIQKRDGTVVDFDKEKVTKAIFRAAKAVGGSDMEEAKRLSGVVVGVVNYNYQDKVPTVEDIQDVVERVLIHEGHAKTAKAYILYRAKRAELRKKADEAAKGSDPERAAFADMFAHKSKLASLIGYDRLEAYKNLLFYLKDCQKAGKLPVHPQNNYLNGNELATSIYDRKYFLKNLGNKRIEKRPEDVFARLAAFMAATEPTPEKQTEWAIRFYRSLYSGQFLPGGRVIAGGGDLYRLKTLANCFVSLIEDDNIESIYKAAYECARTYSYGGGIGVDISVLRPKDSVVHNAADSSSGSVSFMEIYSLTTGLIGQSGRRGALMLTIDVKHPDSPHFINIKKIPNWVTSQIVEQCRASGRFDDYQLREIQRQVRENTQVRFANISLKVSDEFMQAVSEETTYGREKLLLYKKNPEVTGKGRAQGGSVHYSFGIPSKPIDEYELVGTFDSIDRLNRELERHGARRVTKEELADTQERDVFGDLLRTTKENEYELAMKYSGDFMLYYESKETGKVKRLVKARSVWNAFVESNYKTAEPGLIFWSTMSKYSPSNYVGRPIASTNPCAEVPLEDGGACNLASVNLSRFVKDGYTDKAAIDWDGIREATALVTRFLDNVITWNETLNPLKKQRKAASETRRLGLGMMGIADMLNQLGLGYDDEKGMDILEQVSKAVANTAYHASANLAAEKGVASTFSYDAYAKGAFFREALTKETKELIKQKGLRNIAILSIAPTGTISSIVLGYSIGDRNYIGVSGGIEPIFALYYTRRSESFDNQMFKVFHSTVQAYIDQKKLGEKVQSSRDAEDLMQALPPHFFRTSHLIDAKIRVRIQGIVQKYIDHSISSTVNLSEDVEPETISNIYLDAWKHCLKGITVYREGSRHPILSTEHGRTEFQSYKEMVFNVEYNGETQPMHGDSVIVLPDDHLATVYHALKKNMLAAGDDNVYRFVPSAAPQSSETRKTEEIEAASAKTEAKTEEATGTAGPEQVSILRKEDAHQGKERENPNQGKEGGEPRPRIRTSTAKLSVCPVCRKNTLKMESGCYQCLDAECGYSKCDV